MTKLSSAAKRATCTEPTKPANAKNGISSYEIHRALEVQDAYKEIVSFIEKEPKYERYHRTEFYRKADCWVVAHAKAEDGIVVTHETEREYGKTKVSSVCTKMGVKWMDVYQFRDKMKFNPADDR